MNCPVNPRKYKKREHPAFRGGKVHEREFRKPETRAAESVLYHFFQKIRAEFNEIRFAAVLHSSNMHPCTGIGFGSLPDKSAGTHPRKCTEIPISLSLMRRRPAS
jgi:hypothetical protein